MTKLSDYLSERARIDGLSNRAFARRCNLSPTTTNRLLAGIGTPDRETLEKVAERLPAPLEKLLELAGVDEEQPFVLPPEANLLDKEERRTVIRVVRQILRSSGRIDRPDEAPANDGG
jgi:transcriptional regulator with XRE-family HTH domain